MITGARLWEWCCLDYPAVVLREMDAKIRAGLLQSRMAGFTPVAMEIIAMLEVGEPDLAQELSVSDAAHLLLEHAESFPRDFPSPSP